MFLTSRFTYGLSLITAAGCAADPAVATRASGLSDDPPAAAIDAPSLVVTSPLPGAAVSGVVQVRATASPDTRRVELYADGALVGVDDAAPYELAWDVGANYLPAPDHKIDYGYYFVEWKQPATFAARRAETNHYTTTYYAALSSYVSDAPGQWAALLTRSLTDAVAEHRRIHLNLELHNPAFAAHLGATLDAARPFWPHIARIEIADEPSWTLAETTAVIAQVDAALAARALPRPPGGYGIMYVYTEDLPEAARAAGLQWVGLEAYLDPPGSPVAIDNFRALIGALGRALGQVPPGKQIVLAQMAYDRNGAWPNVDTLRDLQTVPYGMAALDRRVVAINLFAYARPGGTFAHPELAVAHKLVAEKILGRELRGAGAGPRTLYVKAIDAAGANAVARVVVTATP